MSDADPYTNIIPGFTPDETLTVEWAREALGDRLTAFAQALAEESAQPIAEGKAA